MVRNILSIIKDLSITIFYYLLVAVVWMLIGCPKEIDVSED